MRIGVHVRAPAGGADPVGHLVAEARQARRLGLDFWVPQVEDGVDALTVLAVVGREAGGPGVGTSCVPVWARHPLALAMQALTAQAAAGGRLTLGVGLSHRPVTEGTYGIAFERPVRFLDEYLQILVPLLEGRTVDFAGEILTVRTRVPLGTAGSPAGPPPVLVAALGERMLDLAGRRAEGALLWMVGPRTLETHVVPHLGAGAAAAGRGRPRAVVHLPVCVTADPDRARRAVASDYESLAALPSYRAVLDIEGAAGPADVAVTGDARSVEAQLRRLGDAGATDLGLRPFGSARERTDTLDLLADLARAHH